MKRRHWLQSSGGALLLGGLSLPACKSAAWPGMEAAQKSLGGLEKQSGGRLGVAALDCATGRRLEWRAEERFAMCSTFKFLLAAAILKKADRRELELETSIPVPEKPQLTDWAPVTGQHAGGQMSVSQLCDATMTWSDNSAANLLLPLTGGPQGLTAFVRSLGDPVTRLDRMEPELNSAVPGDVRDTTAPRRMVHDMKQLLLGDVLSAGSRARLASWMKGSQTGFKRLRAGLPAHAVAGDKTGTAENTANDIAIAWLPEQGRGPWLIASYLTEHRLAPEAQDAIHAQVAALVSRSFV